jgi:hypothetical protein
MQNRLYHNITCHAHASDRLSKSFALCIPLYLIGISRNGSALDAEPLPSGGSFTKSTGCVGNLCEDVFGGAQTPIQ